MPTVFTSCQERQKERTPEVRRPLRARVSRSLPVFMHWFKYTWLIVSGVCLLTALLLFILRAAEIGIRDNRWSTVSSTGMPVDMKGFEWTDWQPNNGQIIAYAGYKPGLGQKNRPIEEYRVAKANDMFFDFTFYQGRYTSDMSTRVVPAMGPFWGTHYQKSWVYILSSIGGMLYLTYWLLFFRKNKQMVFTEEDSIWTEVGFENARHWSKRS